MKIFKIRCSAIGEIMTEGKDAAGLTDKQNITLKDLMLKSDQDKITEKQTQEMKRLIEKRDKPPELSATAKTHCQNWLREQLYGRRKEISSKYCDKGNDVEDASIEFLNSILLTDYVKNEEKKENEYMTGCSDIDADCIRDVKNSWDCYTFPLFDHGIKTIAYKWQLQGYLELYDKEMGHLDYLLMSAPLHIIIREAKSKAYKDGLDYDEIFPAVHKLMTYGEEIDNKLRHKSFFIERDREAIQKVYARVKMCRSYIAGLIKSSQF